MYQRCERLGEHRMQRSTMLACHTTALQHFAIFATFCNKGCVVLCRIIAAQFIWVQYEWSFICRDLTAETMNSVLWSCWISKDYLWLRIKLDRSRLVHTSEISCPLVSLSTFKHSGDSMSIVYSVYSHCDDACCVDKCIKYVYIYITRIIYICLCNEIL